jgi:hypothetical protein
MSIIKHGKWLSYKPSKLPEGAPINALFARRESDGVDWYDYVNSGRNFGADTVKLMASWRADIGGFVIGPAVYDATMLFPAGQFVLEITGYTGTDPQAEFGNKVYDPETGSLHSMTQLKHGRA